MDEGSIEKLASQVPDFGHDSTVVNRWWKIAERCLVEAYPHPTKAGELNEQVPELNRLVRAPSHRKTAGKIRNRILERLENKFYSFAGFKP